MFNARPTISMRSAFFMRSKSQLYPFAIFLSAALSEIPFISFRNLRASVDNAFLFLTTPGTIKYDYEATRRRVTTGRFVYRRRKNDFLGSGRLINNARRHVNRHSSILQACLCFWPVIRMHSKNIICYRFASSTDWRICF